MWIFSNMETGGFGVGYKYTGDIYFYCRTSDTKRYKKPCTTVAPGQWVHIVGVSDAGATKLYVNGVLVAEEDTVKANATLTHPTPGFESLDVGAKTDANSQTVFTPFKGKIATARIYSAVLNQEQITKLYAAHNE